MSTSPRRQEYRQHSKSTLARAAQLLFDERRTLLATERRKWKGRLAWVATVAFLAGFAVAAVLA